MSFASTTATGIRDMGFTVLTVIHCVGWGFITLWILGSCWKEGLWGNAINFFVWCQAALASWPIRGFARLGTDAAMKPSSADDHFTVYAVSVAVQWIAVMAIVAGLRMACDKLSQVKVAFHPVFDGVGNAIFCLLAAAGIALMTAELFFRVKQSAATSTGAASLEPAFGWLQSGGGLPWQLVTLFCGQWVLVAGAVAFLSKPSNRLDRPKKADDLILKEG